LFYDVFDTLFVLNSPKTYDILKILIKNVIKQPGPVGAGIVPVGADAGAGIGSLRCRPVPVPLTDRKKRCIEHILKFAHILSNRLFLSIINWLR
jgi:hypothetical protein